MNEAPQVPKPSVLSEHGLLPPEAADCATALAAERKRPERCKNRDQELKREPFPCLINSAGSSTYPARKSVRRTRATPQHDREAYRAHILAFVGFAFTALCALAIVDEKLRTGLKWAIYYLVVSFFMFAFALNWVAYKGRRWEDQLTTAFIEIGTLSLFLAVVAVLQVTRPELMAVGIIGTIGWGIDHIYRFCLDWAYLSKVDSRS